MESSIIEVSCAWLSKGWVGAVIGIFGVLWGIYAHLKAYRKARLVAQFSRMTILSPQGDKVPNDVKISFKGEEIYQLSKTNVILWNAGSETVEGSAIVEKSPICITFDKKTRILRSQIVRVTRKVNNASLNYIDGEANKVIVLFDYLDPKDGINIELLHDSKSTPQISGAIRGLPAGIRIVSLSDFIEKSQANKIFSAKYFFAISVFVGLIVLGCGILEYLELIGTNEMCFIGKDTKALMVMGGLNIAAPLLYFWLCRKRYPKKLHD